MTTFKLLNASMFTKRLDSCKMRIMDSKQPSLKLTEQQSAQQDLFIDGLINFLDIAGRLQDVEARLENLQFIHLVILRRANANVKKFVSFDRIRADMQTQRYLVSRAADLLERRGFGAVVPLKSDGRYRRFTISREGRSVIDRIDFRIAQSLTYQLGTVGLDSMRYYLLTDVLCNLRSLPPNSGVTRSRFESGIDFEDVVGPDEIRSRLSLTELADKPPKSMTSKGRSILELVRVS